MGDELLSKKDRQRLAAVDAALKRGESPFSSLSALPDDWEERKLQRLARQREKEAEAEAAERAAKAAVKPTVVQPLKPEDDYTTGRKQLKHLTREELAAEFLAAGMLQLPPGIEVAAEVFRTQFPLPQNIDGENRYAPPRRSGAVPTKFNYETPRQPRARKLMETPRHHVVDLPKTDPVRPRSGTMYTALKKAGLK